ncbi:hypothetical protein [Mucilaginibacter endophyticus]|uniref:hypothetical protein n=1 Tax=Mucilaginibacter endophyticus TaxID=2675003 RepID=UPI000E0DEE72|nr:hypothetical protein [Mucilaginibacter endophyticus]
MDFADLINEILDKARWYNHSYGVAPASASIIPFDSLELNNADYFASTYKEKLQACKVLIGIYIYDDYSMDDLIDFLYLSKDTADLAVADIAISVHNYIHALSDATKFREWKLEQAAATFGQVFALAVVHKIQFYPIETTMVEEYRHQLYRKHNQTLFKLMAVSD